MKRVFVVSLLALILVGCNAVDDFNMWSMGCPSFPTLEEVEHILAKHKDLFDGFLRNNLANGVRAQECPQGAYILISHGSIKQKARMLEAIDMRDARGKGHRMFFDIPFSFHNN